MMSERLSAIGNGEMQCLVLARDYNMARRALGRYNAVIIKSFPFISAYGVLINVYAVDDVKKLPCVREVCANSRVTVMNGYVLPEIRTISRFFLRRRVSFRQSEGQECESPCIAFIDTGFCPPLDFYLPRKRVRAFVDFIEGREVSYDDNGHGTAVGCLIACDGRFTSQSRVGSASGADVIALKAVESDGSGSVFHILEAMQWVYDNRAQYNVKVVCMSLGKPVAKVGRDPLCMATEALWDSGITVVASAGNAGNEGVTSPGICDRIITVGSVEVSDDGKVGRSFFSSFSEESGKPEICAPGSNVACVGVEGERVVMSGTSLSAPIVAGICYDIALNHPDYSPDMIKNAIIKRATFIGEIGTGCGFIDKK